MSSGIAWVEIGTIRIDPAACVMTADDGALVAEASELELPAGIWPAAIIYDGRAFARAERIPHPDPEELGGFVYRASDGRRFLIYND